MFFLVHLRADIAQNRRVPPSVLGRGPDRTKKNISGLKKHLASGRPGADLASWEIESLKLLMFFSLD